MSRVVICLFMLFFINSIADVNNSTDENFENNTMQTMQIFEKQARRQWELSIKNNPKANEKQSELTKPSISETTELFTWFQGSRPTIHTIKVLAAIKEENSSSFPVTIGVGSWREIILFGKKKDANSVVEPDASPLSNGSANAPTIKFAWLEMILFVYLLLP